MMKKSLEDVLEFSADRVTKRILFQQGDSVAFVLNFAPGQALPAHRHPGAVLYVLVLEGSGAVTVDGTETNLTAGDVICCGGEELFAFRNTGGEPCRLYVVLSKIPGERYARDN